MRDGNKQNKAKWFAKQLASEGLHSKHPRNRTTLTKHSSSRHYFPQKMPKNVWPFQIIWSPRNLEKNLSPRKCYTTWSRYYFPQKRPPQNVWQSEIFISPRSLEIFLTPRKCYTIWSRHYFPEKRLPQNVWHSEIFLSPRNLEKN